MTPEATTQSAHTELEGSVLVLLQFDVADEIRLDLLKHHVDKRAIQAPELRHPGPGTIRYQRPPIMEPMAPLILDTGERLEGTIKYYDYGVLSLIFELPYAGDWTGLTQLASRWAWEIDFAGRVEGMVRSHLERAAPALVKPYTTWLTEDYLIFHLTRVRDCSTAAELVKRHGARIAQVVRGDAGNLAESERLEVLQSRISYYEDDLAIIGWNAAFLYDDTSGAETGIQLLEYANSQLLDFRHYDDLLTAELDRVYTLVDEGTGFLARWRLAKSATQLQTVLLDVAELTEHSDNAIKFLSDMFAARFYKLAASKVGVPDYRDLVTRKVDIAEDLYQFMVDQFNQSRTFLLELTVVVILIIELGYIFRGKSM
jgi:hypothetical protein